MPEGAHPLPELGKGWSGAPKAALDGTAWPLDFAAASLDLPLRDLRDLVRILGLEPVGTINMRPYRSQGRIPRAYDAAKLILVHEAIRLLKAELED